MFKKVCQRFPDGLLLEIKIRSADRCTQCRVKPLQGPGLTQLYLVLYTKLCNMLVTDKVTIFTGRILARISILHKISRFALCR